ncbi:hypothetical protein JFL47_13480 [Haemophilus haemoglobinophilus]|nr:hypothetical protein [Canicola haemoglobinophilus]MBN6712211.1 hypothetical protein [Canicola haemoglobinophilus]
MKNKIIFFIIFIILFKNMVFLSISLAFDPNNYIPSKSNIFFFEPIDIDSGSGGYWLYGEDLYNYYYFIWAGDKGYLYIAKSNNCKGFNKLDFNTWCSAIKVQQKSFFGQPSQK